MPANTPSTWPPKEPFPIHDREYPPAVGDFCTVVEASDQRWKAAKERLDQLQERIPNDTLTTHEVAIEDEILIEITSRNSQKRIAKARSLLTYSERRTRISSSLRLLNQVRTFGGDTDDEGGFDGELASQLKGIYCIAKSPKYLFWADAVADELLSLMGLVEFSSGKHDECLESSEKSFSLRHHPSGLVVFAGATGTGKTVAATSFILRYLLRAGLVRKLGEAPPHLVTFEDPIEPWGFYANGESKSYALTGLVQLDSGDPSIAIRKRVTNGQLFALTSREKGKDVLTLKQACAHALRQKPTIIFVGEVRSDEDWSTILGLAATGHLVVTTCHASNLVDSFMKIAAKRSRTAEERHSLASVLKGVVHLRNETIEWTIPPAGGAALNHSQTLFQLWRQTSESISNFVVDGLSSLFSDGDNVFSRRELSRRILERQKLLHLTHLPFADLAQQVSHASMMADLSG